MIAFEVQGPLSCTPFLLQKSNHSIPTFAQSLKPDYYSDSKPWTLCYLAQTENWSKNQIFFFQKQLVLIREHDYSMYGIELLLLLCNLKVRMNFSISKSKALSYMSQYVKDKIRIIYLEPLHINLICHIILLYSQVFIHVKVEAVILLKEFQIQSIVKWSQQSTVSKCTRCRVRILLVPSFVTV